MTNNLHLLYKLGSTDMRDGEDDENGERCHQGMCMIDWVKVLRPSQTIRVMSSRRIYLTTFFRGRLSILSG